MEVKCFSENYTCVKETKRLGCTEKTIIQFYYKDVVILNAFAFIKILCSSAFSQLLCILAENRCVELLHLQHRTRCTVSVYHIFNVSFVTYRCVCIFLGRCVSSV